MKLLVTRPEKDSVVLRQRLEERGHQVILNPLLDIEFNPDAAQTLKEKGLDAYDGLVMTSANGVRAFAHFFERRDLALWAVGEATASAAREAGFQNIHVGGGDVDVLAEFIEQKAQPAAHFLHIAANHLAGDLKAHLVKAGFGYDRAVLYHSEKRTRLETAVVAEIKSGEIQGVLFYSPRTASSFAEIVAQEDLKRPIKNMVAYGLSPAVAAKIEHLGWKEIKIALSPNQDALMKLFNAGKENLMTDPKDPQDPKESKEETPSSKRSSVDKSKIPSVNEKTKEGEKSSVPPSKETATIKPGMKGDDKKALPTSQKNTDPKAKEAKPGETGDKKEAVKQPTAKVKVKKKGSWKWKAAGFLILVTAAGGAGAYYTQDIWVPQLKKKTVEVLGLETVMAAPAPQIDPALLDQIQSRLSAVENREMPTFDIPEPVDLTPLVNQINQLENNVSSIKISNGDTESLAKIEELVAKVEGLSAPDLSELTPDLSGIEAENAALRDLVDSLSQRLATLEEAKQAQRSATDTAQALVTALSTLRQALMTSDQFGPQLSVLATLAEGDDEMTALVETLRPHGETGIKSFSALLTTYNTMANDVVRAAAIPDGAHWVEETVKNLTTLVSIRRAPGDLDGEGPLGVVARAEHNMANGDLAQAIVELSSLQGKPREAADSWLSNAKARLLAQETLAALQARVLARINGA